MKKYEKSVASMRVCEKCGKEKSRSSFRFNNPVCRSCLIEQWKADFFADPTPIECPDCQQTLPRSEFHYGMKPCKKCLMVRRRQDERILAADRKAHYPRKYGITFEEYARRAEAQGNVCAVCKKPERMVRRGKQIILAIDHDHKTGKIRGLLCSHCNRAIGLVGDDPDILLALHHYLKENV